MKTQRKADGRRVFTPEFKRGQINRVVRGETTIAELRRELDVARPLLHRWKQLLTQGGERAIAADEDVVPLRRLRAASRPGTGAGAADDGGGDSPGRPGRSQKKAALVWRVTAMTGCPVAVVGRVLRIGRATAMGHRERKQPG